MIVFFLARLIGADIRKFGKNKEYFSETRTFCDAHQRCFERGRLINMVGYLIGREYKELNVLQPISSDMWLNYHALSVGSKPTQAWMWRFESSQNGEGGEIFHDFIDKKVLNGSVRFAVYSTNCVPKPTYNQWERRPFACGYRPLGKIGLRIRHEKFVLVNMEKAKYLFFKETDVHGCFANWTDVTQLECAKKLVGLESVYALLYGIRLRCNRSDY